MSRETTARWFVGLFITGHNHRLLTKEREKNQTKLALKQKMSSINETEHPVNFHLG